MDDSSTCGTVAKQVLMSRLIVADSAMAIKQRLTPTTDGTAYSWMLVIYAAIYNRHLHPATATPLERFLSVDRPEESATYRKDSSLVF